MVAILSEVENTNLMDFCELGQCEMWKTDIITNSTYNNIN